MDELVIDDKKYISTKRAASLTGYAKDYVGQLCREGRVPARLVGRSWYVLESALQDHRFGAPPAPGAISAEKDEKPTITLPTPHYIPEAPIELPEVQVHAQDSRLPEEENLVPEPVSSPQEVPLPSASQLHDAWEEWFSTRSAAETPEEEMEEQAEPVMMHRLPDTEREEAAAPLIEDIVRHNDTTEGREQEEPAPSPKEEASVIVHEYRAIAKKLPVRRSTKSNVAWRLAVGLGAVAAILSVGIAALGSGYFDAQVSSFEQASVITGVELYNK